jgi:hypothetical protein
MKAIVQDRYGSADVLGLRDVEDPVVGEKDVLVRVHAAGCGPDVWHLMTGRPYFARLMLGFRRPKVGAHGRSTPDPASARVTRRHGRCSETARQRPLWQRPTPPSGRLGSSQPTLDI